jgi:hypothetical protein
MDTLELAAKRAQQAASPATRSLTALGATLIPAIVAAVRAYRGEDPLAAEVGAEDLGDFGPDGADAPQGGTAKETVSTAGAKPASHAHA